MKFLSVSLFGLFLLMTSAAFAAQPSPPGWARSRLARHQARERLILRLHQRNERWLARRFGVRPNRLRRHEMLEWRRLLRHQFRERRIYRFRDQGRRPIESRSHRRH